MKFEIQDFPNQRRPDGLSTLRITAEGGTATRLDIGIDELARHCLQLTVPALDFLVIAGACYAVDKLVDRSRSVDRWTRELSLTIPVADPDRWRAVGPGLEETLAFLSGDIWDLTFVALGRPLYRRPRRRRSRTMPALVFQPEAVCLFSGGLDSSAGSIELLEMEPPLRVLLVGHYDAPTGEQTVVGDRIRQQYPGRVRLARTRIRLDPVAGEEATLRTRSLLFFALGLLAAAGRGPNVPVYAFENGHIALNVPLTPSRAGSCSTRTMHPYFVDRLVSILEDIGIRNPVHRPYEFKTKGETLSQSRNQENLRSLAGQSVSCSHAARKQHWVRKGANNCGYCVPCLIRRAAMHSMGWDDGHQYGVDVCAEELRLDDPGDSADDLRAVVAFLRQRKSHQELAFEIRRISSIENEWEHAGVVERGADEIRTLLRQKGSRALLDSANL